MKKMRVAVGSNDGENIAPAHMGMAEDFYIYDLLEDGETNFVEKRKNTSPEEEGKHGLIKKMEAAVEIFKDADIIVGRRKSPNFVNIAAKTKFQPVVIEINRISEIIKEIVKYFDQVYELVEQRKNGERPERILKLPEGQ